MKNLKIAIIIVLSTSSLYAQQYILYRQELLPSVFSSEEKSLEYFETLLLNRDACLNSPIGDHYIYKLHAACSYDSHKDIIAKMLERGAKVDVESNCSKKFNAFHICAAYNNTTAVAELLLNHAIVQGCDIFKMMNSGNTPEEKPIDVALRRNHPELCHFFLKLTKEPICTHNFIFQKDLNTYTSDFFQQARKTILLLYVYGYFSIGNREMIDRHLNRIEEKFSTLSLFNELYGLVAQAKNTIEAIHYISQDNSKKETYFGYLPEELHKELQNYLFQEKIPPRDYFDIPEPVPAPHTIVTTNQNSTTKSKKIKEKCNIS